MLYKICEDNSLHQKLLASKLALISFPAISEDIFEKDQDLS